MRVQLLRPDGSIGRSLDTDSYRGERLNVALLEYYHSRSELAADPVHDDRMRADFRMQAEAAFELLETFFPGMTLRRH